MNPWRGIVLGLAATANVTVPLPRPLAPPVTVMKESSLTAVHEHAAGADTEKEKGPPLAGTLMNALAMMSQSAT